MPSPRSCQLFRVVPEPAGQQFATPFKDRIGSRGKVCIDALQIAQDVEVKPSRLHDFRPFFACHTEMSLGGAGLDVSEDLLLAKQLSRRTGIFRHEHRRGGPRVADQTLDRVSEFIAVYLREGEPAL